jgi:probable HAF family extracellular repeat protein
MNKMIRSLRSTLGTAFVLCGCALTLVGDTSAAFDHKESGGAEHRKRRRKDDKDVGLRGHGFIRDDGVFTTIDAPRAEAFTREHGVVTTIDFPGARRTQPFGINKLGQIVGEHVDAEGKSHGFLLDQGVVTTIAAPGALNTNAGVLNEKGQIVGLYLDAPAGP